MLDRDLRRRNGILMSFTALGLMFVTAAGICGSLLRHWWWFPLGFVGIRYDGIYGGMILGFISRREIVRDFRQRLLDAAGASPQPCVEIMKRVCALFSKIMLAVCNW